MVYGVLRARLGTHLNIVFLMEGYAKPLLTHTPFGRAQRLSPFILLFSS